MHYIELYCIASHNNRVNIIASPTSFFSLILHSEMHNTLQLAWTPFHAAPKIKD